MIKKINHIAVAVTNLEEAAQFYEKVLGLHLSGVEVVPAQKTKVGFFKIGESNIELVQPSEPDSPLVKFLESIQTITASNPPSGAELYSQHCAVCHEDDLKGGGPAPYPFRAPPDLTTLAKRHGGRFPDGYVLNVLRNGVVMPAHGPAEMPIWGDDFTIDRLDATQVTLRITNLTNYIKSRQAK